MDFIPVIKSFKDKNILVIGDLILDLYVWGKVNRISPEAPVPVVEVNDESFRLGGAANVAHNIVSLGGKAAVVGIRGQDSAGAELANELAVRGVNCDGIFISDRPTTIKTRVIAHSQQVVRFDREDSNYVRGKTLTGIIEYLQAVAPGYDALILSDYKKGMISSALVKHMLNQPKIKKKFISVDPKIGHFPYYKGVSMITPNVKEASHGSGIEIRDEKSLIRAGKALQKRLSCGSVLITRGKHGMSLFEKKRVIHIQTRAQRVYDVTGAGDTVISALTLAHAAGANLEEAAHIANHAAGIVVGEVGTAIASREQLIKSFKSKG